MKLVRDFTLAIACLVLAAAAVAAQNNIYIAQNATGANSGTDCSDAHSVAWFNAPENWGAGATQVGPGDTVHLCGTFSATVGSSILTVPGSGSAGRPITIVFSTGAKLTSPAFSYIGAINITGKNYIIVDGASTGIVENTDNGTSNRYHLGSSGVYIHDSGNIQIKHLTVRNIYINQGSNPNATDVAGSGTQDIRVDGDNVNISIHDNTLSNARANISVEMSHSFTGLNIYRNTLSDHCWGIKVGEGNGSLTTASEMQIHDNMITDWTNWQNPRATYHADGIIVYVHGRSTPAHFDIYNNYIYGSLGTAPTAAIFCTYAGASDAPPLGVTCDIFNNVIAFSPWGYGIWLKDGRFNRVYNNTVVTSQVPIMLETTTTTAAFQNNILSSPSQLISSYTDIRTQITASNNNVLHNQTNNKFVYYNDGRYGLNFGQWQGLGYDSGSTTSDPRLSTTYRPQAGSSAIGRGANLTSVGITALKWDKAGTPRALSGSCTLGVTGCWDSGALQFSSSAGSKGPSAPQTTPTGRPTPPAPTKLRAVVN